ncbi:MAG: tail fiber protein, partial [PVC group bacterium]|nr:tail fiber protein [PVC group bacterium]
MIPPGEEITFAYTHKNITSDQYKINQVIYDHKNLAAEYTISSIVRWDIEELQDIQTDELSEQVSQVAETTTINTPVGTILIWSTDTAPEGWLLCDGSAINRDDYADLFAVIGETFGDGNNSTTFEIPDF